MAKADLEEMLPGKRPRFLGGSCSFVLLLLSIVVAKPLACGITTLNRQAEDDRLYDAAARLGGSATVPPGAVDWEGLGYSAELDLDLRGTKTSDADFEQLTRLPGFARVVHIDLQGTKITDATMDLLKTHIAMSVASKWRGITSLDVTDTAVTVEAVRSFGIIPPWPNITYGSRNSPSYSRGVP